MWSSLSLSQRRIEEMLSSECSVYYHAAVTCCHRRHRIDVVCFVSVILLLFDFEFRSAQCCYLLFLLLTCVIILYFSEDKNDRPALHFLVPG